MMYDFRLFNSEICDIPSDSEDSNKENMEPPQKKRNVSSPMVKSNVSSPMVKSNVSSPLWELSSDFNASDFNVDDFNPDELFGSSPIKTGYEHDSDYNPEGEIESTHEEEAIKPTYKNSGKKKKKCYQNNGQKARLDKDMLRLLQVWILPLA